MLGQRRELGSFMRARITDLLIDNIPRIASILLVAALTGAIGYYVALERHKNPGPCDGKIWKSPQERHACIYPDPPIGRWKAVYTKDFAKAHNLPPENISRDLSPGVDYMEMDVQPYGNGGVACLVNMLIKKPNDVAVYNFNSEPAPWEKELHDRRRLAHFIDLDAQKYQLKRISTFGLAPRDMEYDPHKTYGIGSSFAFHADNAMNDYDYITANADCYYILSAPKLFPSGWAFSIAKASVWGRYHYRLIGTTSLKEPNSKRAFFDSLLLIRIPQELIESVFEGMPVGGRQ